jgi:hypothetical protein
MGNTTVSGIGNPAIAGSRLPRQNLELWAVRAAQAFLAVWVLAYLVQALKASFWFDGVPDDGPFQIFDPLRRIAAGQVGGRDFIFFHGIGVPYLHYPLFALFGKSLIASELSRHLTSIGLFVLSLAAFVRVTMRRSSHRWIGAALAVMFMDALFPWSAAPGHSLVSARSTMPVFAFAALQLPIRDWTKAMLIGLCAAIGFACGTEHGISLVVALGLVAGLPLAQALFGDRTQGRIALLNARFTAIVLATAATAAALIFWLLCGVDGAKKAIQYNLVDLPADQFWFFGSPPLPYWGHWRELISDHHVVLCLLPYCFALAILGFFVLRSWSHPLRIGRDWQALAILMLVYGVLTGIPMLGILSRHYAFPLARTVALTCLLVFANAPAPSVSRGWVSTRLQKWPIAGLSFVAVAIIATLVLAFNSAVLTTGLIRHLRRDAFAYSRFLDRRWDSFMANATSLIDSRRTRNTVSLWSVYSAMLEAHYGIFHPAEDYLIHTVGPRRWRNYLATFERTNPEFVQTRTQSFDFQEGLQNERWEFFEAVLDNYAPLKVVEHALIWQRTDAPWRQPAGDFQTLEIDRQAHSVTLPPVSGPDRIAVVRIRYRISNGLAWIPLFGKTPRYVAAIEGSPRNLTISFPPYLSEFQFPVQLQSGKALTLRFRTDSLLPGVTFEPYQAQSRILDWQSSQWTVYGRGSLPHAQ